MPFGLFGSRRATHQFARLGSRGHASPPPLRPVEPHELLTVIGAADSETAGEVTLTLLSVELYREGWIALFRLLRKRGRFEREFPTPFLSLTVLPQQDVPYSISMRYASGGGMPELEYRQAYSIVPAPPRDAGTVTIEVHEISWERWGAGTRTVQWVDKGPWRFEMQP